MRKTKREGGNMLDRGVNSISANVLQIADVANFETQMLN